MSWSLFPWFGGKTLATPIIWDLLGDVPNYVESFFGAGAALFHRPTLPGIETVNDADGFVCNAWRAVKHDAATVARWASDPPNECDLHARHVWLVERREVLTRRLEGDPLYYDAQIAGWWLWGIACWIGGGWCRGIGPWHSVADAEGYRQLLRSADAGHGVQRNLLHLGTAGHGVQRKLLHLGTAGHGVQHLGDAGRGVQAWLRTFQDRLAQVRVCCGDWTRVMGPSVTVTHGVTGILLDPPYATEEKRDMDLYAYDSGTVAHAVRDWCLDNGGNPLLRIVLCGYDTTHDVLLAQGWTKHPWTARGGMGSQGSGQARANKTREMLWASPHCLGRRQPSLF